MDDRLWDVLDVLGDGGIVTADVLAERLGVTSRTVRSVLARSRRRLEDAGATIEAKPGVGYHLRVNDPDLFDAFQSRNARRGLPRTSDERVRYLLELLLTARDYVKLDEVAEVLFVSRKTLAVDLHRVEEVLSQYSLLVDRKPYHGIKVVGAELDVRHCLAHLSRDVADILDPGEVPLEEIVRDVFGEHAMSVSDSAFSNLLIHLSVALKRVQLGSLLRGADQDMASFITAREFEMAEALLTRVGAAAGVQFPAGELSYIALNLAAKRILGQASTADHGLRDQAQAVVGEMLGILDATYGFGLTGDPELTASLIQHIIPLLVRLRFGMHLTNPVLSQIKQSYPLAFVMASHVGTVLSRDNGRAVTEDELGYIAMWLALSLQRARPKPRRKRVLVVCATGTGSAKLLEFAFNERFADLLESVRTIQAHHVMDADLSQVDLIFTTVPLPAAPTVPVHHVHDFLDDSDNVEIRRALTREPNAEIACYLSPRLFLPHLTGRTHDDVIREIAEACSRVHDLPELFTASVLRREELSSTDFGNLVAMPHAEVAMSPQTFVCVGILDEPIHWARHDVQVVFLVSISSREGQDYRRFYSTLSQFLMSREHVQDLIRTRDFDALVEALHTIEQKVEAI